MKSPDVTLTDFALALVAAGFALALLGGGGLSGLYALLFAALAVAALAGGIWHGWFAGQQTGPGGALWLTVMLSVGLANLALWRLTGALLQTPLPGWIGWGQLVLFAALALFVSRSFLLTSAFTLPPTLALLWAFAADLAAPGHMPGAAGLAVALAGAGLQAARIGLPALRLSHNGLYHIVQAIAFTLVFLGANANPVSF
ncbi:DUF6962 family protein [Sinisalibacter aestuarii]|uniref:Uncharacterized protein n=1 Tax=Sinisalibacter aestuarii TaxID=2949426 RepID=A0ABQ5LQH8_9RHOB|nr:hypothetical protein [Sinisalibacter aestuarii]GKY87259.1 hypothetical protein STA1M1_11280 [Sinisalibacter aestuarii]